MNTRRFSLQVPMGTEPSGSGRIKVDENYPSELDDPPPFDVKRIENIRSNVKFDTLYTVTKLLGDGKFGKVYCAIEKATGKEFAAKFIKIRKEADRAEVEREVSILTQLRHPRIAQIYDAFYTTTNDVVLIMEIVRGGELFDRVAEESYELSELAVVMIICQLCEAIDYIHKQNILHLDVKPENIMCVSLTGNRIKLIDFGLARHYDGTQELKYMAGTPEFAAPEVIKFEKLDYHTDMWSIGVITYILLSGYSPFLGDNLGETYCNVEKGVWEFTEEFDTVSPEAKDFVSNLLIYDQSKRMLPHECLQHPWIAIHRQKAACNSILEKPLNAPQLDNKQIMRYNAKRKFRRMIIYVKFLIEMNRLRNSLKTRMSANGHKFFDPLLKMAEKKEQKITDVCSSPAPTPSSGLNSLVQKAIESKRMASEAGTTHLGKIQEEHEEKKEKKTKNANESEVTKAKTKLENGEAVTVKRKKKEKVDVELKVEKADVPTKLLKIVEVEETVDNKKSSTSSKDGKLAPPKIDLLSKRASTGGDSLEKAVKALKTLETAENGDIRRKSSSALKDQKLIVLPPKPLSENGDVKKVAITDNGEIKLKKKKKVTTVTAELEKPKDEKKAGEEEAGEKRKTLTTKKSVEIVEAKLTPISDKKPDIQHQKPAKTSKAVVDGEVKVVKMESVENTKENNSDAKNPKRQGALRKRDKSTDKVLNAAPAATTLSNNNETSVKHSIIEVAKSNGEVVKSEKVLTKKKSLKLKEVDKQPVQILEDNKKIPKIVTTVVNFESKPIKKHSKIVKLLNETPTEVSEEKKPMKLVMTAEKKETTTVQTTTSLKRTTKSSEKKVEHNSDGKSVESLQKRKSQQDDLKICQVTTKKEETPNTLTPQLSVKKNVVKQNVAKSTTEKEQKTTEVKDSEKTVKKTTTVKDKGVKQLSVEQTTQINGEKAEKEKLTGTASTTRTLEVKGEEVNVPRKSSLKKATAKITEEKINQLDVSRNDKMNSLKAKETTTIKITPDSASDTSSSKSVRIHITEEQSLKSSKKSPSSSVSTRDSSEERKKVRFAGDIEKPAPQPLFGSGLQKMKSESSLHKKLQESSKKTKDDVMLTRKGSLFVDVDYQPSNEFSFEALRDKLTRRVSEVGVDSTSKPRRMVSIPPTNSVKDRLKQFEIKMSK